MPIAETKPFRLPSHQENEVRATLAYCSGVLTGAAVIIEHQFPEMAKLLRKAADRAAATLSETRS